MNEMNNLLLNYFKKQDKARRQMKESEVITSNLIEKTNQMIKVKK